MQTALANTFVKFVNLLSFHKEAQTVPDGVQVRITPGFGSTYMPSYLRKAGKPSPNDLKIKLATDFKQYLRILYPDEARQAGQIFRQTLLLPKLKEAMERHVRLEVDIDHVSMLLPGFLREAFGGLITVEKLKYEDIVNHLVITTMDRCSYVQEINGYLQQANEKENN
jgi:hypothetical protein